MDRKGKALVTGAAGFVGNLLCDFLEERGWEVLGCDAGVREPSSKRLVCDITDPEQVRRTFEWAGEVTHVFHLAAVSYVPESISDPLRTMEVNLHGTVHIIEALREKTPGARLIYVGSGHVYGHPRYVPLDEEHPLEPTNPYAISKAAADHYCRYAHRGHGADIVVARPFNHSGPGQTDRFVLSSFARQIAEIEAGQREAVLMTGDLSPRRDFMHVHDVLRAYERIALSGLAGTAYNVCSGQGRSVQSVVDTLLGMAKVPIRVETDPERLRPVDIPEFYGTSRKLLDDTGWQPEIGFDRVLESLLQYWRQAVCGSSDAATSD